MPPRKFLKIRYSEIDSDSIFTKNLFFSKYSCSRGLSGWVYHEIERLTTPYALTELQV